MNKLCNAILEFGNKDGFVMCELEEGHNCCHRALNFQWEGEGITKTPKEILDRGKQEFRQILNLLSIKEKNEESD